MLLAQSYDLACNCLCGSVVSMRGGVKERGTSAGAINQDRRGIKIGGWGSGRKEESVAHNKYFTDTVHKTLCKPL